MKKFLTVLGVLFAISLVLQVLGITPDNDEDKKKPTKTEYTSVEDFEKDLEDNYDLKDVTVSFSVTEIKEKSSKGYTLIAGKHLYFLLDTKPESVSVGDTVTVKTSKVKKSGIRWYINCSVMPDSSVSRSVDVPTPSDAITEAPTSALMPTDAFPPSPAATQTPTPTLEPTKEPSATPTPTPTPEPTLTPTPTPEPIPEYTTNTLSVAREGKEGWFTYVNDEGDVHEYVFVDFDEKLVYLYDYDTKKPSESFGACFLLTGGDLNSGINVKGYTDTEEVNFSYRFEIQRVPDTLVMKDSDGSTMKLKATDLIAAADLLENVDVYDFTNPANIVRTATPTPAPKHYTGRLDSYETDAYVYYVVNINTYKFHEKNCRHVKRMYEENTNYATENGFASWDDARNWLINHGYSPCGTCCP
ncbi:MAG: hypothetical protein IJL03_07170 [Lachnospiraceae bacterium]|nr:hypothetical protein [Lachnospiraceae bacterium]